MASPGKYGTTTAICSTASSMNIMPAVSVAFGQDANLFIYFCIYIFIYYIFLYLYIYIFFKFYTLDNKDQYNVLIV